MSTAQAKARQLIDENPIMVFSKSYCPYCAQTKRSLKATLEDLGADEGSVKYVELDQMDDGTDIQDALYKMTDQKSVPNIFIKKSHIGGNSHLQAIKREDLKAQVKGALEL